MKQQFTIRITAENKEDMAWIWEAMNTGETINGVIVDAMSNGDMFRRLDLTKKQLDMFEDDIEDLADELIDRFHELAVKIDKTFERNI